MLPIKYLKPGRAEHVDMMSTCYFYEYENSLYNMLLMRQINIDYFVTINDPYISFSVIHITEN